MTLEIIAAGLGRNGTLSMKFALEALGFGPCHHMTEVFADGRRQIPLWLDVARGEPDWEAIFSGYRSTSDYPSATYWRELADYYPDAKIVLTTRDPDRWFDSVSETIFSRWMQEAHEGTPEHTLMQRTIFDAIAGDVTDRAFLTEWYAKRNQAVSEAIPEERLLHFDLKDGWAPLCEFLGAHVPELPFPHVNSREELGGRSGTKGTVPADPMVREHMTRMYIQAMRDLAFGAPR